MEGERGPSRLQSEAARKLRAVLGAGQGPLTLKVIVRIWVPTLSEMGNRCTILKREATYYKLHFTKDTLKQTILQINYNSLFKNGLRKIKEHSDFLPETGLWGRQKKRDVERGVSSLPPSFREEIAVAGGGSAERWSGSGFMLPSTSQMPGLRLRQSVYPRMQPYGQWGHDSFYPQ